jgi:hypothetical protein
LYKFQGKQVVSANVCSIDKASRFDFDKAKLIASQSNNANGDKGQAINLYDAYIAEIKRIMTFKNDLKDFLKEQSVTEEA